MYYKGPEFMSYFSLGPWILNRMFLKGKEKTNLRLQESSVRAKLMTLKMSSPACGNFWREQSWTKAVPFEVEAN